MVVNKKNNKKDVRSRASGIIKLVIGLVCLAVIYIMLVQGQKYPMQRFCKSMEKEVPLQRMIKTARERNFILPDRIDRYEEEVTVYNNNWPVLRYGCTMTFDWEKSQSSEFFVAW